jgi:hypothetical protein
LPMVTFSLPDEGTAEDTLHPFRVPSAQPQYALCIAEMQGLDFASEESKDTPESIGQAYRASRRLRCLESRVPDSSDVESEATKGEPESSRRLSELSPSDGYSLWLDFSPEESRESKDMPDRGRRLHRRPEGSSGSNVASEATEGKPESNCREAAADASPVQGYRILSIRHMATYTGAPDLARERASAHSAAVTAVHAAARRERARDAAARRESLCGAVPPREVKWV